MPSNRPQSLRPVFFEAVHGLGGIVTGITCREMRIPKKPRKSGRAPFFLEPCLAGKPFIHLITRAGTRTFS